MRKLLLIAGAVCALAFFTASAQAAHGCGTGYGYGGGGYGGGGHGGYRSVPSYNYGYRGNSYNNFYAPRRVQSYYRRGHDHHHHGSGLHLGGRRLHVGFHF